MLRAGTPPPTPHCEPGLNSAARSGEFKELESPGLPNHLHSVGPPPITTSPAQVRQDPRPLGSPLEPGTPLPGRTERLTPAPASWAGTGKRGVCPHGWGHPDSQTRSWGPMQGVHTDPKSHTQHLSRGLWIPLRLSINRATPLFQGLGVPLIPCKLLAASPQGDPGAAPAVSPLSTLTGGWQ